MKKVITFIASAAFVFTVSAANIPENQVAPSVKNSFMKLYSTIKNVQWEKKDNVYYANFNLEGSDISAAYSEEGELIAMTRKINTSELPKAVKRSLKDNFPDFNFNLQSTEVQVDGTTYYIVDGQDNNRLLKMKCFTGGEIEIMKKTKK